MHKGPEPMYSILSHVKQIMFILWALGGRPSKTIPQAGLCIRNKIGMKRKY